MIRLLRKLLAAFDGKPSRPNVVPALARAARIAETWEKWHRHPDDWWGCYKGDYLAWCSYHGETGRGIAKRIRSLPSIATVEDAAIAAENYEQYEYVSDAGRCINFANKEVARQIAERIRWQLLTNAGNYGAA